MARTVGVKYIKLVKDVVKEAQGINIASVGAIQDYVMKVLPVEVFDTWEGAYSEVERIVWDEVMRR